MVFLRISHIFGATAFNKLFKKIEDSNRANSYENELNEVLGLKIDNCAALTKQLRNFGYQTVDIYYDLEWLQKKWAYQNSEAFDEKNWQVDILAKQIKKYKPDIVFIQKSALGMKSFLDKLKSNFPFIRLVIVHSAYLGSTGNLSFADLLLAGTPSLVQKFKLDKLNPYLFYHYFDEENDIYNYEFENRRFGFTFLGSSGFGHGYMHAERYSILCELIRQTNLELWLYEDGISKSKTIKSYIRSKLKGLFNLLPSVVFDFFIYFFKNSYKFSDILNECLAEREFWIRGIVVPKKDLISLYPTRCHYPVIGRDYYDIMANSKISFHKQGGSVVAKGSYKIGDIGALRLFEATGLGSCLVADTGPNMKEIFEEDHEVVTYKTNDEAIQKIKYLLENESTAKRIAEAGRKRTLKDHTASKRAEYLHYLIIEKLKNRPGSLFCEL